LAAWLFLVVLFACCSFGLAAEGFVYPLKPAAGPVGLSPGAEPQVPPAPRPAPDVAPDKSRPVSAVEHLRLAAEQLEAAGLVEEAANLRLVSKRFNEQALRSINELDQHAQELQKKSRQLQRLIGRPKEIQCVCRFLELSPKSAAEFEAAAQVPSRSPASRNSGPPSSWVCGQGEDAFQRLRESGKVTVLMESRILATPGRPATATTGGELPILVPAAGGRPAVDYRRFGLRCDVTVGLLASGKINLDVLTEIVERDYDHAVTLSGGELIPGLTTRRCQTRREMHLGETLAICLKAPLWEETWEETAQSKRGVLQAGLRWLEGQSGGAPKDGVTLITVTPLALDSMSN
jgi:hypothetical protein